MLFIAFITFGDSVCQANRSQNPRMTDIRDICLNYRLLTLRRLRCSARLAGCFTPAGEAALPAPMPCAHAPLSEDRGRRLIADRIKPERGTMARIQKDGPNTGMGYFIHGEA